MRTILLSAAATLALAPAALAQQAHVGAGYTVIDGDGVNLGALTLRGGYDFTTHFGVEGEASLGVSDDTVGGVNVDLQRALGAFAIARMPVGEGLSLHARGGYANARIKASMGGVSITDSEDAFAYGVGAEWMADGQNGVRFDYTRYDFRNGGDDANVWTLSYVRRFGGR
ncbi:MAG: porin family protein [Maricaulaceae bacterium]|nr:porin family protein [Maricaulaceae bacterium]